MRNKLFKLSIIKHSLVVLVAMLFALLNIGFFVEITEALPNQFDPSKFVIFDGTYDWEDTIVDKTESTDYLTYTEYRNTVCTVGSSSCDTTKIIRFDTAEELYRFSVDVSFSEVYITGNPTEDVKLSDVKIEEILDQHYVLGSDIDYSVMKSKTFIPVGYIFADVHPTNKSYYERYFTGIFDGQGFEIKNLYLSGHEFLIYEDTSNPETIDIAMTEYYGMFNYNAGIIKNIGFVDMYTELLEMHPDLTKLTNVVGFNMPDPETWTGSTFTKFGSIENIYVIDNRTSVTEAGIRYLVGTSSEDFEAAGIVHTNAGNFENSYFVSKVVVNANFINKFTVEPVLFSNNGNVIVDLGEVTQQVVNVTGSSSNLVYDNNENNNGVYLSGDIDINGDSIVDFTVKVPDPLLATGVITTDLKSGNFTYNSNSWYFYPSDGYPILKGLDYVGGVYQINDAYDLAFFSKLLNKNSVLNGTDFAHSDYVLTTDIDMSILAPGSYVVPRKIFYGTFSGANGDPDVLTDNFYIYGLAINGGYSVNNEHYTGLFSRLGAGAEVKDIIFSESTISLANTNNIYSQTFYMGAIAGKMTGATVENILLDVTFDLGNDALSKTYLGSVVGSGSGIINRVSNQANIDFDSHTFTSEQAVNPEYYIGGIVGATSTDSSLSIYDAVNSGNIYGFETTSDIVLASGVSEIDVFIGGIVGKINNTEAAIHNLVAVTNKGNLYPGSVKERLGVPGYQYVGGVFGMLEGKAPILEEGSSYRFANLYNEGDVFAVYSDNTAEIKSAGIGISNTNEDVEYALMFNHGTFDYDIQNLNFTDYPYSSDLFISEYGEGSGSYDRWIEIFNGTNQTINLSSYSLGINTGSSTSWSYFTLNGTLAPGQTHVVTHSSAPTSIRNFANQTTSIVMGFTGDDAIGLFKSGSLIDIFGVYANDPGTGWTVNGISNATSNHTLIRSKDSVEPTTTWIPSDWEVHDNLSLSFIKNHRTNYDFNYEQYLFTASILDISNDPNFNKLTLTRVYNYADFNFDSNIYSNISPFFNSLHDNEVLLRFSENNGDVNYYLNSGNTNIISKSTLNITAITSNNNVDFINFHNNGNITVLNIDLQYHELYVAGFSKLLSQNRIIENSINTGNIFVADISGSGNVYISGIVNINLSGDLHESYQSQTQPIATEGIINTINYGGINTHFNSTLSGILGTGNTFIGGLSTLNVGSIQDSANLGSISAENNYSSGAFRYETSSNLAGLSIYYESGIVAGGVSAMAISGTSRIYDSSNNGDVIAKANYLVRTGGVLGVSLFRESISGGITYNYGLDNNIQNSILSNGLNFGNISSITNNIGEYDGYYGGSSFTLWIGSSPTTTGSFAYTSGNSYGTEDRPAVYSSAGGVIGYGLSYMRNMLNHGTISSTDVAGGVVGATYVLGDTVTVVNINTAVNYGRIKSIDFNDYSLITTLSSSNLTGYYMSDGNDFIYPIGFTRETPGEKRGFGGIFGRLQRGLNGYMTSEGGAFSFIVNADPNIDLIGRLDQVVNFSSSLRFFRFPGSIYYSAKLNDTTQAVFSGFEYASNYLDNNAYQEVMTITYQGYTQSGSDYYHNYLVETEIYNPYWQFGASSNANQAITVENSFVETRITTNSTPPGSLYTVGQYILYNSGYRYLGARKIPWITEDPNDTNLVEDWTNPSLPDSEREYMYGQYFPMRTNSNLSEYIYYAEYDLLADRFRSIADEGTGQNVRENGMYVLSTTAGQEFGAVLPRNISPSDIELINEDLSLSITELDYDNLAPSETNNLLQTIIDRYEELYQTRYNDKAELTDSPLQNLTLVEDGGSNTVLSSPTINYATKEITFTISMEAFNPALTTASFNIYDALISSNALIASRYEDYYGLDELIISEYVEGSDGNFDNAIEIFNGTGEDVDLSTYKIEIYRSGSSTADTTITLSGTLVSGDTYLIVNDDADQEMLDLADYITNMQYNGDDAIKLVNGTTDIDTLFVVGVDPGTQWTWGTNGSSMNRTLVRNATTLSPTTTWDSDEWLVYDADTRDYLGFHNEYLKDLSSLLYPERYDEISTDYPAFLEVTLPPVDQYTNLSLGYFSVYSEAFINDPIFAETFYYNDYEVFINFTPDITNTGGTTGIQYVSFNGGGNVTLSSYVNPQPSSIDISSNGDVNYNGSLKLIFNDGKGILNEGYDFIDNFTLYYMDGVNEVEVDIDHYSVSSVAVTAGGIYEVTFNFNDALLKAGNYRIKYSYFSASTIYTVNFDKAASNQAIIEDLNYYSYDDDFSPSGTSFTTYINMGKIPSIDGTTSNFTTQTIDPLNPLYREYLSNTYYDISFMYQNGFVISSFATVTRAQLTNTTYSNGYKTYTIQYDITAEDDTTTQTFTHTIIERTVELTAAYKDGNDVPLGNITTTREALTTRFEIDLGFDTSDDMSGPVDYSVELTDPEHIEISVVGIELKEDDLDPDVPITNIVGLTYSSNNYLIIDMSSETLPGTYTFTITYNRGATVGTITFAELEITKFEGTSAYLTDIKFTPIASESKYPTMDITNEFNADIAQTYNPAVYFFGIDYDGADVNNYEYFRVYGQVNNIPLESYYPYMLDYLPLGATVSRYDPTREDWASRGYYSPEVSNLSTEQEKGYLAADFTEVVGDDNIFIRYRITSEDGDSQVYYNIKVNDITYNVTLIFDIYYCDDQDVCVLASNSSEFTEVVQINVYNLYVHSKDSTFADPNPDENNPLYYPTFSRVSGEYNSMTQFVYTDSSDYNYRFGRNRAGFYIFEVVLPYDQYLNDMYTYEIDFNTFTLDDADDLTFTSEKDYNGKYYYITYSEANRTRRFDIKIYRADVTGDKPFGLFDFFRTWS